MAAYSDLRNLFNASDLRNRVTTATVIAAYGLLGGTPTAADRAWAQEVFKNPDGRGQEVLMAVLAANKDQTTGNITGATDAAIQTAVDAVVPQLVLAFSGS